MFCTECGTKLDDSAVFCTNCGHKLAGDMSVAEPVVEAEPVAVAEPVQPAGQTVQSQSVSQSMYSEPVGQTVYAEPASQPLYSEPSVQTAGATGAMYGAAQGVYGANQNMYGASQNMYGAGQNTYANNPTYNYNAQQPKKKGKGCLIAVIIASIIGIIGVLLVVLLVVFGVTLMGSGSSSNDIEDIHGFWTGTSDLVSVSGEDEMQEYLEELYGRPLTDSEIDGLADGSYGDYFQIDIYEYEDEYYESFPGSWNMDLYMGSFFGTQNWDDWDALSYYEFENDRSAGCIELDANGRFEVDVTETDYLGEYACVFFDSYDYDVEDWEVAEDGEYGITFSGQVTENSSGDKQIEGEITITFQYGDMSEPYVMEYEYILDDCSAY